MRCATLGLVRGSNPLPEAEGNLQQLILQGTNVNKVRKVWKFSIRNKSPTKAVMNPTEKIGSCTLRLKWPPLSGALGEEYAPQGHAQAQRQTYNTACKKSNIPSKITEGSATMKSSTARLSTRPIAVAATRFRPVSEPLAKKRIMKG